MVLAIALHFSFSAWKKFLREVIDLLKWPSSEKQMVHLCLSMCRYSKGAKKKSHTFCAFAYKSQNRLKKNRTFYWYHKRCTHVISGLYEAARPLSGDGTSWVNACGHVVFSAVLRQCGTLFRLFFFNRLKCRANDMRCRVHNSRRWWKFVRRLSSGLLMHCCWCRCRWCAGDVRLQTFEYHE